MRIEIDIDEKYSNTEVIIKSPRLTEDIEKMISLMRIIDMQIAVKKNDETFYILKLLKEIPLYIQKNVHMSHNLNYTN